MKQKMRFSIAVELGLYIVGLALCIGIVLFSSIYYYSYHRQIANILEYTERIQDIFIPQLSGAAWDYNDEQIEKLTSALREIRHVRYIAVATEDLNIHHGTPLKTDRIEKSYDLTHPLGGIIGTLTVQFDLKSAKGRVFREVATLSAYILTPVLVMVLAILLIFRILVTRHLDALAEYARKLSVETLHQGFQFDRKFRLVRGADELDRMLAAILDMQTNLNREIKDRQQAEKKLSEAEALYQEVFNATGDAIIIHEASSGRVLDVNQTMLDMYGYDRKDPVLRSIPNLSSNIHPYDSTEARRRLDLAAGGEPQLFEWMARKASGETFWVEVALKRMEPASRNRILATVRDISKRKKAELELRQFQKMDSIGQLAGGIAHDFNNMLAGILGAAEMIQLSNPDPDIRRFSDIIMNSAQQAAGLTTKLLAFSRRGTVLEGPVNLHNVIRDAASILERSIDKRITLNLKLDARFCTTTGDTTEIQSAILNLGLNARDAISENGSIAISTKNTTLDDTFAIRSPFPITPGEYIDIRIQDDGIGMSREIQQRIFEPFFTTKAVGKGTGLGLSALYGTVSQHKGAVSFYSEPGCGTVFHVYLPVTRKEDGGTIQEEPIETGSGCILVIDDEDVVRYVTGLTLESLGYKPILAEDGQSGIRAYTDHQTEIDAVILDIIMPDLSGHEVLQAIRNVDPKARVILASGFSEDKSIDSLLKQEQIQGFLAKPYRKADLAQILAVVLKP